MKKVCVNILTKVNYYSSLWLVLPARYVFPYNKAMKLLLADDHGLFRDSMAVWLKQLNDHVDIVFASSFDSVCKALDNHDFDLLMLDLGMPGMQGALSIRKLLAMTGVTPLIVVSADENSLTIQSCLDAGAAGYVTKSSEGETILKAARSVLEGGSYIPPSLHAQLREQPGFTDKQMQLLALLAEGRSNRYIADEMHLAEGTVKQYVTRMLRQLDVDNRMQAGLKARKILGITDV